MSLFKTVMVVTYERTEGCVKAKDTSDSVIVDSWGEGRSLDGMPFISESHADDSLGEPMMIEETPCLNASHCQVWEMPGIVNSSMVTMLVGGPSYDKLYFKPFETGTPLDKVQSYFLKKNIKGVVVALDETAPSCLNLRIMDITYSHVLRWNSAE